MSSAERREQLIMIARGLFAERGFDGTSVEEIAAHAEEIGFAGVMAGPLVRSSYRAGRLWAKGMRARGFAIPERLAHLDEEGSTLQEASTVLDAMRARSERRSSAGATA